MLDLLDNLQFIKQSVIEKQNARKKGSIPGERWTKKEFETLAAVYPSKPIEEILAALPGRTWEAIKVKATLNGIRRNKEMIGQGNGFRWSDDKLAMLKLIYPKGPRHLIEAVFPEYSWTAISIQASKHKITRQATLMRMTKEQHELVSQVQTLGRQELMRRMPDFTWHQIYRAATMRHGIVFNVLPDKDLEILWRMYLHGYEREHICAVLDIKKTVYGRALSFMLDKHKARKVKR